MVLNQYHLADDAGNTSISDLTTQRETATMSHTLTGSFPIGYRSTGTGWRNDLDQTIAFAIGNGFEAIDVQVDNPDDLKKITDAGLRIGSVDLPQPWTDLTSEDSGKRQAAAKACAQYVRDAVAAGASIFFVAVLVEDRTAKRRDNLDRAADGYGQLCQLVADTNAHIVVEGWPGPGPQCANLACTPEGYRTFLHAVGSDVMAVNFDPSHLVRMHIDPVRFLDEFIDRVHHVHAKDTMILADDLYNYGSLQTATLGEDYEFGEYYWRYTIPGHGVSPWKLILSKLKAAGFDGIISIELEDMHFCGSEEKEQQGMIASREFLIYC